MGRFDRGTMAGTYPDRDADTPFRSPHMAYPGTIPYITQFPGQTPVGSDDTNGIPQP